MWADCAAQSVLLFLWPKFAGNSSLESERYMLVGSRCTLCACRESAATSDVRLRTIPARDRPQAHVGHCSGCSESTECAVRMPRESCRGTLARHRSS